MLGDSSSNPYLQQRLSELSLNFFFLILVLFSFRFAAKQNQLVVTGIIQKLVCWHICWFKHILVLHFITIDNNY